MRRRALLRAVAGGALAAPVAGCTAPATGGVIEYEGGPNPPNVWCREGFSAGVAVQNRHDEPVSIDVALAAEDEGETHDWTFRLDPWGRELVEGVAHRGEHYELRVDLDGATETWEWTVEDCRQLQLRVRDADTVIAEIVEPIRGPAGYGQHNCYPGERSVPVVTNQDDRSHVVELDIEGPGVDFRESFDLDAAGSEIDTAVPVPVRLVAGESYEITVTVPDIGTVQKTRDASCLIRFWITEDGEIEL